MKQDSQSSTTNYAKISINFKDSDSVISFKKASEFSAVCQDHRNGLETKIHYIRKHLQVIINYLMNDALDPTYQARQMEEFEVKLHDDGIPMKVETK